MSLWLPPYLSLRRVADRVRLGILPPLAWDVEEPPEFLVPLLSELSRPTDRAAAVECAIRHSGWSHPEAQALIADLEAAGALVAAWERTDRYDRHQLYYHMLGVLGHPQDQLAGVTVGLIGMGGIGTHLAVHLTAAGIGGLVITDGDHIELSNLTRQTLFREADVGRRKVEAAVERLCELRSDLRVDAIPEAFAGPALAAEVAARADIVLLSADRPADVHSWTNAACLAAGRPFSAAGYIEGHGCVGPLLRVPETPCFECIRLSAHALADQQLDQKSVEAATAELNPGWQAPSYGPLNALVAAIQANEAIRWLLGTRTATVGRRLLIDSRTYDVTWEDFEVSGECDTCGRTASDTPIWHAIASQYQEERDHHSFNAVLLDDLVPELLSPSEGACVADIGAGAGQITARLLARGCQVDAYEPAPAMLALLRERLAGNVDGVWRIIDQGIDGLACLPGGYDAMCCLNVLDHVEDLDTALRTLADALRRGGTLVVSVPHPLKDRGGWKKIPQADDWSYQSFVVEDYFDEGPCQKVREDRYGEIRVRGVVTQHRTIASYLNAVLDCGLEITRVLEPAPTVDVSEHDPVIYSKASRIPYFLVIVARKHR